MSRSLAEITDEAMALSPESRALLAERLLGTLVLDDDFPISPAWQQEIAKREREIDDGTVQTVPAETVFREVRRSLQ